MRGLTHSAPCSVSAFDFGTKYRYPLDAWIRSGSETPKTSKRWCARRLPMSSRSRSSVMAASAAIGHAMATNAVLDVSALNAVTSYEPNELIVTLQAGAPLADVLSLIDAKNQQFAFEPMNTAPLLGTPALGTIGGMIAAGLAGPRRIKAGGARDHLLGRACRLRLRRQLQDRRQGGEERHRLRPLQAAGGLLGHAVGDDRGDAEGDAEARSRADAAAARARRCHRQQGDDRGARLALRRLRRRASAEIGVPRRGPTGLAISPARARR